MLAAEGRGQTDAPHGLIELDAEWRYLDTGQALGPEWREAIYDDSGWQAGVGEFGYGDGDELTIVSFGPDEERKHVTTYFRHRFQVESRASIKRTTLRLVSDDGAVVYVNGVEVYRYNMPEGEVDSETLASMGLSPSGPDAGGGRGEEEFVQFGLWAGYLMTGTNVLAVEIHQASASSEDCSFHLELIANRPLGPPSVELLSPTNGVMLAGPEVVLRVEATDFDGHIYRVDYFAGTNRIGQAMTFSFSHTWLASAGRYRVQALAFDYSGRRSYSDVASIQVGEVEGDRLVRGPYLQVGTPTGIVVCWRTDWLTEGVVRYGTEPGLLNRTAVGTEVTAEHAVVLEGLKPGTKYFYSVNTPTQALAGGPDYFFVTAPAGPEPTRIWVIGDSGTADDNARFVRDIYKNFTGNNDTDLWLMLGDNAYELGTDQDYQAAVFDMYPEMLRQTVVWPTIGNHDAALPEPEGRIAYLDIFRLPRQGEAGGMPSGTENYYSFDYSNIHFICLDSALSGREPGGAMLSWLESDLAATGQEWIIAFWHHSLVPYRLELVGDGGGDWQLWPLAPVTEGRLHRVWVELSGESGMFRLRAE